MAPPSPPFLPGDPVYDVRRPEDGSLTVEAVTPYRDGKGWGVVAVETVTPEGLPTLRHVAPADEFRPLPPDWTEPPECPLESPGYDAAGIVRRRELAHDETHQARVRRWLAQRDAWLAALRAAEHQKEKVAQ